MLWLSLAATHTRRAVSSRLRYVCRGQTSNEIWGGGLPGGWLQSQSPSFIDGYWCLWRFINDWCSWAIHGILRPQCISNIFQASGRVSPDSCSAGEAARSWEAQVRGSRASKAGAMMCSCAYTHLHGYITRTYKNLVPMQERAERKRREQVGRERKCPSPSDCMCDICIHLFHRNASFASNEKMGNVYSEPM